MAADRRHYGAIVLCCRESLQAFTTYVLSAVERLTLADSSVIRRSYWTNRYSVELDQNRDGKIEDVGRGI